MTGLRRLAWLAFSAFLVVSPFRASLELTPRATQDVATFFTRFAIGLADLALLLTLGLWLSSLATERRRVWFGPAWLAIPVAALLAVVWLGVPGAVDPALAAYSALRLTVVVALAVFVLNELDRADRLAVPVAAMIAVQAAVGIGQSVAQRSVALGFIGERRLDPDVNGLSVVALMDGSHILRAYGLTDHPNVLGGILAAGLLTLAVVLGRTRRERIVFSGVFAIGVLALLVTFSRAAWLGFGVGTIVGIGMLALIGDRPAMRTWLQALAIGALLCIPALVVTAPYLAARAGIAGPIPSEVRSIDERVVLAGATADIIGDRPWLGTGLGTLPVALAGSGPMLEYAFQPAHLVVLDAAAETGILGAICYLAIVIGPWVALLRGSIRARWTTWLAGASAALAAVTVVGLFDYYTWTPSGGRLWAWVALGAWVAAWRAASVPGVLRSGPTVREPSGA
jgi:O-antigen ligase